ncbi:MAG: glutamine-hydrolyzing carbamoyl-phosphate synthase small subunit [archaeon]
MIERKAKLILQDGSSFEGFSFGFEKSIAGEVVFNTGMVGYPETLTDPSYHGQILTLAYPLIGNYGIPENELDEHGLHRNFESDKIQIKALIISDYSKAHSHWNSKKSLSDWLVENRIPALCGIDTRKLTIKLREHGVMLGKIIFDDYVDFFDPNNENLVARVSALGTKTYGDGKHKVLLIDCGAKNNIIRSLIKRDCSVTRVPWDHDFFEKGFEYDGIFISNGPGDPKMCTSTISNLRLAMSKNIPIMGICLGNQLLALAAGADTYKLKYGHRSQNQPCIDIETGRCYITSQNHGYSIKEDTIPNGWKKWFVNANDDTVEGIKHVNKPFFSVQFHPEATPGPVDTAFVFDKFIEEMK